MRFSRPLLYYITTIGQTEIFFIWTQCLPTTSYPRGPGRLDILDLIYRFVILPGAPLPRIDQPKGRRSPSWRKGNVKNSFLWPEIRLKEVAKNSRQFCSSVREGGGIRRQLKERSIPGGRKKEGLRGEGIINRNLSSREIRFLGAFIFVLSQPRNKIRDVGWMKQFQ